MPYMSLGTQAIHWCFDLQLTSSDPKGLVSYFAQATGAPIYLNSCSDTAFACTYARALSAVFLSVTGATVTGTVDDVTTMVGYFWFALIDMYFFKSSCYMCRRFNSEKHRG